MSETHVWLEQAAAYALGSLDSEERAAFQAHLDDCRECQAEVRSYQEVSGLMGYVVPMQAPPAHLKERVLAEARQVRPFPPRSARGGYLPWLAAAASMAITASALFMYAHERSERTRADRERVSAQMRLAQLRQEVARRDSILAAVLAPDGLSATLVAPGRTPTVRLYKRGRVIILSAQNLAPAPAGRTYQLWGIAGGKPVSIGTFNTDATGRALVTLAVAEQAAFELSAVTDEPAGGSPQPTTTPFIAGPWR